MSNNNFLSILSQRSAGERFNLVGNGSTLSIVPRCRSGNLFRVIFGSNKDSEMERGASRIADVTSKSSAIVAMDDSTRKIMMDNLAVIKKRMLKNTSLPKAEQSIEKNMDDAIRNIGRHNRISRIWSARILAAAALYTVSHFI